MLTLPNILIGFLDTMTGHLSLVSYLLAVTDERAVWKRLRKLPPLLLSPVLGLLANIGVSLVLEIGYIRYFIASIFILVMCTLWTMWAWRQDIWRAFSSVCMAAILQVASSALAQIMFLMFPEGFGSDLTAMAVVLLFSIAVTLLLKRVRFGAWFCLLLEDQSNLRRTAALLFSLEAAMEVLLILQNGVQMEYLAAYYMVVILLVALTAGLIVYLSHRFDDSRLLQAQQDIIAQQQLYEQDLEDIRQEVRAFRHDYKNLLAGLSEQAGEGRLDELRTALKELDADFDRQLGEKIRLSVQTGNLQIPQVRSLLLSKLAGLREHGVECRLEALYPVESVGMNIWDFIRCLGILADNAAEAALETERPWVEIILLAQGGRLLLRISNPYTNALDPGKMWDEGWSTKGKGRGEGLFSYQRILEGYPNASACTSWEGGVFIQELTVEDRP